MKNTKDRLKGVVNKDPSYRMEIIEKCYERAITELYASRLLGISVRQVQRLIRGYKKTGKLSLVHGLTNKPSNNADIELKQRVLELIKQDKYRDFGPTLLSEYLHRHEHMNINPLYI
jgi:transposase